MLATGCTCKNTFTIPFNRSDIQALVVTYCHDKHVILEKNFDECTLEDGYLHVHLSQEDTLKFKDDVLIEIQIKVKLTDGSVEKSNVVKVWTDEVLNREVL